MPPRASTKAAAVSPIKPVASTSSLPSAPGPVAYQSDPEQLRYNASALAHPHHPRLQHRAPTTQPPRFASMNQIKGVKRTSTEAELASGARPSYVIEAGDGESDEEEEEEPAPATNGSGSGGRVKNHKKRNATSTGRRKIAISWIEDKSKRHVSFTKRKAGLMKKAFELSTLTGTEVLVLVVSETGVVYTYATPSLKGVVEHDRGKQVVADALKGDLGPPLASQPPSHHNSPAARDHPTPPTRPHSANPSAAASAIDDILVDNAFDFGFGELTDPRPPAFEDSPKLLPTSAPVGQNGKADEFETSLDPHLQLHLPPPFEAAMYAQPQHAPPHQSHSASSLSSLISHMSSSALPSPTIQLTHSAPPTQTNYYSLPAAQLAQSQPLHHLPPLASAVAAATSTAPAQPSPLRELSPYDQAQASHQAAFDAYTRQLRELEGLAAAGKAGTEAKVAGGLGHEDESFEALQRLMNDGMGGAAVGGEHLPQHDPWSPAAHTPGAVHVPRVGMWLESYLLQLATPAAYGVLELFRHLCDCEAAAGIDGLERAVGLFLGRELPGLGYDQRAVSQVQSHLLSFFDWLEGMSWVTEAEVERLQMFEMVGKV